MPHILDSTVDGVLQCESVNHPPSAGRDTMYFLEANGGFLAFGCKLCTEIQHSPQLHFMAANKDAETIFMKTRKAEKIERNEHGTIISFR